MSLPRITSLALTGLIATFLFVRFWDRQPDPAPVTTGLELITEGEVAPTGPEIRVDSAPRDLVYPVWLWAPASGDTTVGAIETVAPGSDVLDLSGWAGDVTVGLRMSHVLIVACSRVIATVPVATPRADIRERHPNLPDAGWSARVALADLGPCRPADVTAYGVARFGDVLFPLEGSAGAPQGAGRAPARGISFMRADALSRRPGESSAPMKIVKVGGRGVELRRCGREGCAVIGRLPAGRQRLIILDRQEGWALVSDAGGAAGWTPTAALPGI